MAKNGAGTAKKNAAWVERFDLDLYGECRLETGHRWKRLKKPDFDTKAGTFRVRHGCMGCATERRTTWNLWDGSYLSRSYIYPENYQLNGVGKRPANSEMRVEYFRALQKRT